MALPVVRPACTQCGAPATIGTNLDSDHPDWRCVKHMERSTLMRAVKLSRLAAGQRCSCAICGRHGEVPVIYEWRLLYFCRLHSGESEHREVDVIGG